jgi:hypothetical protein
MQRVGNEPIPAKPLIDMLMVRERMQDEERYLPYVPLRGHTIFALTKALGAVTGSESKA